MKNIYIFSAVIPLAVVQLQMDSTSVGGKGISISPVKYSSNEYPNKWKKKTILLSRAHSLLNAHAIERCVIHSVRTSNTY